MITMPEAVTVVGVGVVALGFFTLATLLRFEEKWRVVIRAYLEARCNGDGKPMVVEEPVLPPPKMYAPLEEEETQ